MAGIGSDENLNPAEASSQREQPSENTPLIGTDNPQSAHVDQMSPSQTADEVSAASVTNHFRRLRRLTAASIAAAIIATGFDLSAWIFYNVTGLPYYLWWAPSSLAWLSFLVGDFNSDADFPYLPVLPLFLVLTCHLGSVHLPLVFFQLD